MELYKRVELLLDSEGEMVEVYAGDDLCITIDYDSIDSLKLFNDHDNDEIAVKNLPDGVKQKVIFKLIQKHMYETYVRKNADYGNSFGETYQKLGPISAVTRLNDKMNRLVSLSVKDAQVTDESIEDTLLDLANYAIMTLIEMQNK